MILVRLLLSPFILIIYFVFDLWKDYHETCVVKYYTIERHYLGFYTITLWAAEVYILKNKYKKKPVKVECMTSKYKCDINEKEKIYRKRGIYPVHLTYGAECCVSLHMNNKW